jgi:hypothetical protein
MSIFEEMTKSDMKYYLVGFENSDAIGVQGLITELHDGTAYHLRYIQNGTSRKPSTRNGWVKASVAAATPRTFTGYIVQAASEDQAIRDTEAFRNGAHWTIRANEIGEIRMVRNGRIRPGGAGADQPSLASPFTK